MMDQLVQWFGEQLDADARNIADPDAWTAWHAEDCESLPDGDYPTYACSCGVAERVRRWIEADRALIADYVSAQEVVEAIAHPDMYDVGRVQGLEDAVRRRAAALSDRPGYREEWRPAVAP